MAGEGRIWPVRLAVNEWPVFANCVEEPPGPTRGTTAATTMMAGQLSSFALCGEDRGRKGDELRQFSQILGGGGQ